MGDFYNHEKHLDIRFCKVYRTFAVGLLLHGTDHVRVIGNQLAQTHTNELRTDYHYDGGTMLTQLRCPQEGIDLTRNVDYLIYHNEVYGDGKEGIDVINSDDGRILYNYVHHCGNGIYIDPYSKYTMKNLEVAYNRVTNTSGGLCNGGDGTGNLKDAKIHHNIVYDGVGNGISHTATKRKGGSDFHSDLITTHNTVDNCGYFWDEIGWLGGGCFITGPDEEGRGIKDLTVSHNIFTNNAHYPLATTYKNLEERNINVFHNLMTRRGFNTTEYNTVKRTRIPVEGEQLITDDPQF